MRIPITLLGLVGEPSARAGLHFLPVHVSGSGFHGLFSATQEAPEQCLCRTDATDGSPKLAGAK